MTVLVPPPLDPRSAATRRLVTWSWAMLPLLLLSFTAAELLGNHLMSTLDVTEGELLWHHGAWGVLAAIAVLVVLLLPPAVGIWLGVRAQRAGGGQWAVAAWAINLLLVVMLAVPTLVQALVA